MLVISQTPFQISGAGGEGAYYKSISRGIMQDGQRSGRPAFKMSEELGKDYVWKLCGGRPNASCIRGLIWLHYSCLLTEYSGTICPRFLSIPHQPVCHRWNHRWQRPRDSWPSVTLAGRAVFAGTLRLFAVFIAALQRWGSRYYPCRWSVASLRSYQPLLPLDKGQLAEYSGMNYIHATRPHCAWLWP